MPDAVIAPAIAPTSWVPADTDAELLGHLSNKGWDKKTAAEAALDAAKSHRDAERLIGVPANEIVRLPKVGDTAAWDGVYQRVNGAPKAATEYNFSTVKMTDGTELDAKFVDHLRATAFKNHMSPQAAIDFAKDVVANTEATEKANAIASQADIAREKDALFNNWGKNRDSFMVVAQRTAEVFGLTAESITALEGQVGYKAVMEGLLKIGQKIGEDKFITNQPGSGGKGALTKQGALARRKELMSDEAWAKRYDAGGMGSPEYREMADLIKIERAGE